uniref:CD109 antigen n=1 Tax=Niponia nodulosa TaxID=1325555 RepID=A0A0E4B9N8_9MYRI|nr:thioester-containing protein 1 [Niponia nodulosa]
MANVVFATALLVIVLAAVHPSAAERTYTVTAPKNIRIGTPYQVVASIHNTPEEVQIFANLSCTSDDIDKPQIASGSVTVPNEATKMLNLTIPDWWKPGSCELTVSGDKGIVFKRSASLGFNSKTSSVFIQTDKAIYQPGQLVQFRVLVVDPNLRPSQTDDLNVFITDAQGNRIKQWNKAQLKSGIFSGELQLSDQPVLGDWVINAQANGSSATKAVTVEEYVLPKFEVTVRPPALAIFNDSEIIVGVDAKYTYGKPVKGKVMVNVTEAYCRSPFSSYCGSTPVVVRTNIDGTANVKIPISQFNFPDYYKNSQASLDFLAVVTEDLTGRTMNASAQGIIYSLREKIDIVQSSNSFKPGLPHTYKIKLQLQDGTPVTNADAQLTVKTSSSYNKPDAVTNYTIPANGVVTVDAFPDEDADFLRLNAEYKQVSSSAFANKAQSISNKYLQLSLHQPKDKDPKVGETVQLDINGTFYISRLEYEVVARGKIVASGSFKFDKDAKSHSFPLNLTQDMAPRVRVVAYHVSSCGEVVADSLDFTVDGVFQTPVALHTSENRTKPGAPMEVTVSTLPNATVGLLAIDQSVLLLKTGNDLNRNEIVNDLNDYESGWKPSPYDRKKRSIWRPPGDTITQLFDNAGLVFLSNGLFQKQPEYNYGYYRPDTRIRPMFAMASLGAPAPAAAPRPSTTMRPESNFKVESREKPTIRKSFPETWIWSTEMSGSDGQAVLKTIVPDTITSWQLSAFAMDDENGLGMADGPQKVEVFRPFFVTLNLPYSIVRGESVAIQALVFNYMKEDVEAEVTLDNPNDQFELTGLLNRVDADHNATSEMKTVKVKAGDGTSVSFLITPKVVGPIDLTVTAKSSKSGDALNRKLLVKAEGSPQFFNKAVLVDLRNSSNFKEDVEINIPPFAVKDSEHVEVSAIGDIMGPTVNNLDKLIKMPYGCGEQNMVNFVPNIAVADYLNTTNQFTDKLKNKAIKYMEAGYQRELTYKRSDGSFSAFGNSDKNGSTWLTAFVVRSFKQAKPYISVDDNVIDASLKFLQSSQAENGSFPENGEVHSKRLQGGAAGGLALTAYVVLAFLENSNKAEYHNVTKRAVKYLEDEIDQVEDPYELAIATFALEKAKSPAKDKAFQKLDKKSVKKGDVVFWSKPLEKPPTNSTIFYYPPPPVDIEMTAYVLQSYLERGRITDAIPIMRWLITQRNENGGFSSTQDTVVGIQALASMASHITSPDGAKMDVNFDYGGRSKRLTLDKDNAMVLQREELPPETRNVSIKAEGKGVGIVQITWSYNLDNKTQSPVFEITPTVKKASDDSFDLIVCAVYDDEDHSSNMAVIEMNMPSGYVVDGESLPQVGKQDRLKRVDTVDGGTKVQLYYDEINDIKICPQVTAYRTFPVANVRPAAVSVYDYYENERRAESFYDAPKSDLCDICSGNECAAKCKKASAKP